MNLVYSIPDKLYVVLSPDVVPLLFKRPFTFILSFIFNVKEKDVAFVTSTFDDVRVYVFPASPVKVNFETSVIDIVIESINIRFNKGNYKRVLSEFNEVISSIFLAK